MARKTRDRFRRGSAEWVRLGELLAARRAALDASYADHGGRAAFARSRHINLKLVQDIELNARENFTALTLRDQIAPAYEVTYESIRAVLAGTGDLVPARGTPRPRDVPSPAATRELPPPVPDDGWLPPLLPGDLAAARDPADEIWLLLARKARDLGKDPETLTGEDLFGAGTHDAWTWDLLPGRPVSRRVWLVARRRAAAEDRHTSGAGLAALPSARARRM